MRQVAAFGDAFGFVVGLACIGVGLGLKDPGAALVAIGSILLAMAVIPHILALWRTK